MLQCHILWKKGKLWLQDVGLGVESLSKNRNFQLSNFTGVIQQLASLFKSFMEHFWLCNILLFYVIKRESLICGISGVLYLPT